MKKCTSTLIAVLFSSLLLAQDVRLNDSIIFINDKPVALYTKTLSNLTPYSNMEVYGFDDYVLIKAEAIKFNAPVAELKSFYYYELSFPPTADTFALYIEEEAFPIVLAKIIRDYDLINKNELNKKNVARFITQYSGGPALTAKIKFFEDYLNDTRYFNEQVKRDRTKPVSIINDRVIMQDGVKIGLIAEYQNTGLIKQTYEPATPVYDSSRIGVTKRTFSNEVVTTNRETQIVFANDRKVENNRYYNYRGWSRENPKNNTDNPKLTKEKNLYQISKSANKKISSFTDQLLMRVCFLIEDYAL